MSRSGGGDATQWEGAAHGRPLRSTRVACLKSLSVVPIPRLSVRPSGGRCLQVELANDLNIKIGQAIYKSPTVFSFFRPDYAPEGSVQAAGLVAPEAQLGVLPYVIGFMDGVNSLVFDGLSSCRGGFGARCNKDAVSAADAHLAHDGVLGFKPTNASSAEACGERAASGHCTCIEQESSTPVPLHALSALCVLCAVRRPSLTS